MKNKFTFEMTDEELEQINLIDFTGLNIGDRVKHKNAGQAAGSSGIIYEGLGTIIGHQNQGLHHWGGLCVTVDVKWDNGEIYRMGYNLAIKQ